jgi:hypothetical protein
LVKRHFCECLQNRNIPAREQAGEWDKLEAGGVSAGRETGHLAARLGANDGAIGLVNQKLPDGLKWIDSAELIARKLRNFKDDTADVPRITKNMRLSTFQYSGLRPYSWPL